MKESDPIYLKLKFLISMSFLGISEVYWVFTSSSSSFLWISFNRSKEILASCSCFTKSITWCIGLLSCPIMYCIESIIPKVSSPSITNFADRKLIRISFMWLIKLPPTDCTCSSERDWILNLNSFTWRNSQLHRFCFSALWSFISCIPLISSITLLCSEETCENRL